MASRAAELLEPMKIPIRPASGAAGAGAASSNGGKGAAEPVAEENAASPIGLASINVESDHSRTSYVLFSHLIHFWSEIYAGAAGGEAPMVAPSDMLAWHHIFYVGESGVVRPVASTRFVELDRCDRAGLVLPSLLSAQAARNPAMVRAVETRITQARESNHRLVNTSDFAITEKLRRTPQSIRIHHLVAALVAAELADGNTTCIGFATDQTRKFFEKVGYRPVTDGDRILDPKSFPVHGDAWLIEAAEPSDFAKQCLAESQNVLTSRLRG